MEMWYFTKLPLKKRKKRKFGVFEEGNLDNVLLSLILLYPLLHLNPLYQTRCMLKVLINIYICLFTYIYLSRYSGQGIGKWPGNPKGKSSCSHST